MFPTVYNVWPTVLSLSCSPQYTHDVTQGILFVTYSTYMMSPTVYHMWPTVLSYNAVVRVPWVTCIGAVGNSMYVPWGTCDPRYMYDVPHGISCVTHGTFFKGCNMCIDTVPWVTKVYTVGNTIYIPWVYTVGNVSPTVYTWCSPRYLLLPTVYIV